MKIIVVGVSFKLLYPLHICLCLWGAPAWEFHLQNVSHSVKHLNYCLKVVLLKFCGLDWNGNTKFVIHDTVISFLNWDNRILTWLTLCNQITRKGSPFSLAQSTRDRDRDREKRREEEGGREKRRERKNE